MKRFLIVGLPMARSALRDATSAIIKTIRQKRKNHTISHIPLRTTTVRQNLAPIQKECRNEDIQKTIAPVLRNTRRRLLSAREWQMAHESSHSPVDE